MSKRKCFIYEYLTVFIDSQLLLVKNEHSKGEAMTRDRQRKCSRDICKNESVNLTPTFCEGGSLMVIDTLLQM